MKERPILFNGAMVRAILEGRKTVTRRLVKGGQIPKENLAEEGRHRWSAIGQHHPRYGFCVFGETASECAQELATHAPCPYGRPGDRLWVRETTEADYSTSDCVVLSRYTADKEPVMYLANDDGVPIQAIDHWDYPRDSRPSIHMKRDACRILLEITGVRVERLQDISEEQAEAEGVHRDVRMWFATDEGGPAFTWPQHAFAHLWRGINGAESWDANPWVWVVEFKRVTP